MTIQDDREHGRNGTPVQGYRAAQGAVERLTRLRWPGLSVSEQEEVCWLVMEKYFDKFGRDEQPPGPDGKPNVPIGWLKTVISTTGIDLHRKKLVQPFDPADLQADDDPVIQQRLFAALDGLPGMATLAANRLDLEQALENLAVNSSFDFDLIQWRFIDKMSIAEIAELTGKTESAVRKRLQRAVEKLQRALDPSSEPTEARSVARRTARRG